MSVKALQAYTQFSKYARFDKELGRKETWDEQINRVFKMHEKHLGEKVELIREDFEFARRMANDKMVLGSQRALQFGGEPILVKHPRLYNCSSSHCDRPRFFQECMHLLLCGCGTGFSVQKHHVARLPEIYRPTKNKKVFIIDDSIEGWADSIGVLLSSYFCGGCVPFPEYNGHVVEFDFSKIRPEGAMISWGSKAPGPNGLRIALEKIRNLMEKTCKLHQKLRPIDAYDIIMHASDAVLSGGVRRSACIAIFSKDDDEMMNAKTGSWFIDNPQRGRSNNSVLLMRDTTTYEEFASLVEKIKQFGEPGFIWADNEEALFNPCAEIGFFPKLDIDDTNRHLVEKEMIIQNNETILSGWNFCNLCEINVKKAKTKEEFLQICRAAAILGTIQASYTNFEYLGVVSELIARREALLGVSMTGMADNPDIAFNEECQREGAQLILKVNEKIARQIGISPCARATCIKPAGCRPVHGLLTSKNGLITLGEALVEHDIRQQWDNIVDPIPLNQGGCRESFARRTYVNGMSEVVKVKLNYGFEIICTPEHKWFVDYTINRAKRSKRVNRQSFVEAQNLQVNDVLKMDIGLYDKTEPYKFKQDYRFATYHKCLVNTNPIKQPLYMNENIAWLLGYLWGDGSMSIGKRRLRWIDQNVYNLEKVQAILKEEFNIDSSILPCKNKNAHTLDIGNVILWNFLELNNIFKYDEEDEIDWIPFAVRTSRKEDVIAFLSGMLDSDGGVYEGRRTSGANNIVFSTASEKFSSHFQEVASSVGLVFGRSLNSKGNGHQAVRHLYLMQLSPHVVQESFEIFRRNSCKLMRVKNNNWHHDMASGAIGVLGKVLSVEECHDTLLTVDIESDTGWYYAGAIKTHNSTSCVLGTASGIHPHHAKRYFRRVQANKMENSLKFFQQYNPLAVEESVWSTNKTDVVITFLCEVPDGAKTKNQVDALTLLNQVKFTQQTWIHHGKRIENCVRPWLNHNVSNTCNIKPDEWKVVTDFIYENKQWFCGISMLPVSGDKDYPQAPFTAIYTPKEIVKHYGDGSMFASGLIVDGMRVFDNNLWAASDCAMGIGEILTIDALREKIIEDFKYNGVKWKKEGLSPESPRKLLIAWLEHNVIAYNEKIDWVRRAKQFASRYFGGDVKKMTYCLKDVYNWKVWCDLSREYVDVDWSLCKETGEGELVTINGAGEACSGGACEAGELGLSIREAKR